MRFLFTFYLPLYFWRCSLDWNEIRSIVMWNTLNFLDNFKQNEKKRRLNTTKHYHRYTSKIYFIYCSKNQTWLFEYINKQICNKAMWYEHTQKRQSNVELSAEIFGSKMLEMSISISKRMYRFQDWRHIDLTHLNPQT